MSLNLAKNKTRTLVLCLAVAMIAAGLLKFYAGQASQAPAVYFQEGQQLPESLGLVTIDGKNTNLGAYKGKVILINFWAGWCGPCLHEMPSIAKLYKKFESRGLVVLAPSMDDIPQHGVNVLKRVLPEIPFPVFHGLKSEISNSFELDALPHTVVLDKSLNIKFSRAGEVDWNSPQAIQLIEGLL